MILAALRETVCEANRALPRHGLVTMTSGNASARDPETGCIVIKPSGVPFEELKPRDMCVLEPDGDPVDALRKPSVDAPTHLYVYRHMPGVNGIVHTHSNYATSFAALGEPIPAVLTAICDEFGGPIPCAPYCQIGEEEIGRAIVEHIGGCPAVLVACHGAFTVGPDVQAALKAAVMLEDVAKTVHLALLRGEPLPIPPEEVERAHRRYLEKYGQG